MNNFILANKAEVVPITSAKLILVITQFCGCFQWKEIGKYALHFGSHLSNKGDRKFVEQLAACHIIPENALFG